MKDMPTNMYITRRGGHDTSCDVYRIHFGLLFELLQKSDLITLLLGLCHDMFEFDFDSFHIFERDFDCFFFFSEYFQVFRTS